MILNTSPDHSTIKTKIMKMKLSLLVLNILLFVIQSTYSQNLGFDIHGKYSQPVKKETLMHAKTFTDFISGYPSSWITKYVSTGILTTNNGVVNKAPGMNDQLTSAQINLLASADLNTDIVINVKHNFKNSATGIPEPRNIEIILTLIPDVEAQYPGGNKELKKYIRENIISKIDKEVADSIQNVKIRFIVNERGEVENANVFESTGDKKTDILLRSLVNKIPKWKPAADKNGNKVKQEFEIYIWGQNGC
jgi:hypothetical protein